MSVAVATLIGTDALAQRRARVEGTVQWVSGQTLVLLLDAPAGPPQYTIVGPHLVPTAAPRPTVQVDLRELPQSEYAYLRSGDRVAVVGVVSSDGRRLIGSSIIRDIDYQLP
jgi:hypothetical protein